ncbi:sulfatase-like hydrolase/transferase [Ramlibacter sp. AW1]|uniref:Sulfatase-like hydrolase/transferase n=2 Tax=Ramlibacter aurantiacus TaxID=2801330 RepID=A0A936ZDP6_9BURK|nr:sulfatase-like hydrolase/transferase [Ramlibacter aurantiacus]
MKPNFLLITTDQQRADHLGCYGNRQLRTPHIDALAARGRRFDRFYVATGVCMANRASLMTGRMPSVHGTRCNGIPLARDATTFADLLRDDGYWTGLVGKCHLQNMTDMPPEMPREPVPEGLKPPIPAHADAVAGRWSESGYDQELLRKWREDPSHRVRTPYYGFDHVDLATLHGDLVEADYARWLQQQTGDIDRLRGAKNAIPDDRYSAPQAWRTRVPEHQYPSAWVGDRAEDFLQAAAQRGQPFFLHCSFADPHHPFTPPGRYWDMYDPDEMVLPRSFYAEGESSFAPVAALHRERALGQGRIGSTVGFAAREREAREALALTYGMISMIDDVVGRVLSRLQALGLDRDTVVIFTSDHGDFMGDHGLLLKSALHYQSLVRVPFIWAEPPGRGALGAATDALASTIDIPASVLARAGLAPFHGMQGRSLLPVLAGQVEAVRDAVLIEEDGHAPTFGLSHPVRARTVVTASHRLTIYDQPGWVELVDLREDPHEMHNLVEDPRHAGAKARLFETLARELMMADDRAPFPMGRA